MAKQIITKLVDDTDGTEAAETVTFSLDGSAYEIDLSAPNASAFRDALGKYVANAQRIGRVGGTNRVVPTPGVRRGSGIDTKAVRDWAVKSGITLNDRGRIPTAIVEQYNASGGVPVKAAATPETVTEAPKATPEGDTTPEEPKGAKKPVAKKAPAAKKTNAAPKATFSGANA
ncbi:histone-like nucleoid-structuring protein Lsr2 [Micromonospora salmantinae]|uniref:histone-like nucleoid-structuring protein Lsr2 n=1 Tax=Micromonospora salmantinae TaxID=2911211 RepID=UPI0027E0824B|nr:Lsr2 family protein [Micromonospora salmantinae]